MYEEIVVEFTKKELQELIQDKNSCVTLRNSTYNIVLLPHQLSNISASIRNMLNLRVAKYDRKLGGILLSYKNIRNPRSSGSIVTDSFYIHLDIEADFYIFKPDVGCMLKGIVNKMSKDHIGCLVHRIFNVSVPIQSDDPKWAGNSVDIGEEVLLNITYINLACSLPYIRASFVSTHKKSKKLKKNTYNQDVCSQNVEHELEENCYTKKKTSKKKNSSNEFQIGESNLLENNHQTEENELNLSNSKKHKRKSKSKTMEICHTQNDSYQFTNGKLCATITNSNNEKLDIETFTKHHKIKSKSKGSIVDNCVNSSGNINSQDDISLKKNKRKSNVSYENDDYLCSGESNISNEKLPNMTGMQDRCVNLEYSASKPNTRWDDAELDLFDSEFEKTLKESKKKKSRKNSTRENGDVNFNKEESKKRKADYSMEDMDTSKKHKRHKRD